MAAVVTLVRLVLLVVVSERSQLRLSLSLRLSTRRHQLRMLVLGLLLVGAAGGPT